MIAVAGAGQGQTITKSYTVTADNNGDITIELAQALNWAVLNGVDQAPDFATQSGARLKSVTAQEQNTTVDINGNVRLIERSGDSQGISFGIELFAQTSPGQVLFELRLPPGSMPALTTQAHTLYLDGIFCEHDRGSFSRLGGQPHSPAEGVLYGSGQRGGTLLSGPLSNTQKAAFSQAWKDSGYLETHTGNAGALLGLESGLQQGSGAALTFNGTLEPEKSANASTLHVSIPEFAGVRTYDGGRSDIAKTLAVLTRGEFSAETEGLGSETAVLPYQNWIDVNNPTETRLNLLTCQVRDDSGTLCADLRPETSLTLKVRQNPQKGMNDLLSSMRLPQVQGVVPDVKNVGS